MYIPAPASHLVCVQLFQNGGLRFGLCRSRAERGLDPSLAKQVAEQLMAHDAVGARARD
jgi:hypothetical protein